RRGHFYLGCIFYCCSPVAGMVARKLVSPFCRVLVVGNSGWLVGGILSTAVAIAGCRVDLSFSRSDNRRIIWDKEYFVFRYPDNPEGRDKEWRQSSRRKEVARNGSKAKDNSDARQLREL